MTALSAREADIFRCVADTVVAPPAPAQDTDPVALAPSSPTTATAPSWARSVTTPMR